MGGRQLGSPTCPRLPGWARWSGGRRDRTVKPQPDGVRRWHFGDRYYWVTLTSTPTTLDLELDDLGPGIGRGLLAVASCDDASGAITVRFFTEDRLPIALVDQFLTEATERLGRSGGDVS